MKVQEQETNDIRDLTIAEVDQVSGGEIIQYLVGLAKRAYEALERAYQESRIITGPLR